MTTVARIVRIQGGWTLLLLMYSCAPPSSPSPGSAVHTPHSGDRTGGDTLSRGDTTDDHQPADSTQQVDADRDGLDDAWEDALARRYLPYLSLHRNDKCERSGIIFRLRPHPTESGRIHIVYDRLFENDCGITDHPGDNEAFGLTINPELDPPAGIEAIIAIAHQGTPCQAVTNCGQCEGMSPCDTAGLGERKRPIVYFSRNKHASYALLEDCTAVSCLDACELNPSPSDIQLLNVGEPGSPLINNLTTEGFIRAELGWSEPSVMNVNPWDSETRFGGAGNIRGDLVDTAFVPPSCP